MTTRRIVSIWMVLCASQWASALVTPTGRTAASSRSARRPSAFIMSLEANPPPPMTTTTTNPNKAVVSASTFVVATTVWMAASFPLLPVSAYDTSDYASETVQEVLQSLKTSSGNEDATFKTFENIAGIITEGKGVGGMVNYSK